MEFTCDSSIRRSLKLKLSTVHCGQDAVVIDELKVCSGTSRIDIAVVNGRIEGFEIKSDKDSLDRLARQAKDFSRVVHRMTLVVGQRHMHKAIDLVPEWWGVQVATSQAGKMTFETVKKGRLNAGIGKEQLLEVLERLELQALICAQLPGMHVSGLTKRSMIDVATRKIRKGTIDAFVRHALKVRARTQAAIGITAFGRNAVICSQPSPSDADLHGQPAKEQVL